MVIGSLEKEFAILQENFFSGFERLADVELLPLFTMMEKKLYDTVFMVFLPTFEDYLLPHPP